MDNTRRLCLFAGAALLAGCASMEEVSTWNPPPPGSSWRMSQKNSGSYGKDAVVVLTRTDADWNGQKVVKVTDSATGGSIMMVNAKWLAIVTKDGKPAITYDPPIGYEFPMKVGQSWKQHQKATNHLTGKTSEYDYSCTVEAREKVVVYAGQFDAFRILCDNDRSRDVYWFAPEPGVNVKAELRRKPANPSGEGTQYSELAELNVAK